MDISCIKLQQERYAERNKKRKELLLKICRENGICTEEELLIALEDKERKNPDILITNDSSGKSIVNITYPEKQKIIKPEELEYNCIFCGIKIEYNKDVNNLYICNKCKCPNCGSNSIEILYNSYTKRMKCKCGWKYSLDER